MLRLIPQRISFLLVDLLGVVPEIMQDSISSPVLIGGNISVSTNNLSVPARTRKKITNKAHYERNKSTYHAQAKAWHRKNPKRSKELAHQRYLRRKQYHADYCKKWRAANPEKLKASRRNSEARRRAKGVVRGTDPVIKEFYRRVSSGKVRCYYCSVKLTSKATVDHIIAIDKGGKHEIGNLCAACEHCNFTKWNKPLTEWQPQTPQGILPL